MELNYNEKDKQIGIQKRWKYLKQTKFLYFHIFTIVITLVFETYFFIRLRGTFNNPKPVPTTFFGRFADIIKSLASDIYTTIVPNHIVTGIEMANNIIFNIIIVALLLVLLISLFIFYTYSTRILSIMTAKTYKQVEFFYRKIAIFIPTFISIIMILFIEWDHITDRIAIDKFKKENTDLINKEDYLRVFYRNSNIENNLALIYKSRYQTIKTQEFDRLISSMINSFEKRNKLKMNDTNFYYIINNLIPVYNQSIRNIHQYAQSYNKIIRNSVCNSFKNRINYLIDNTNYIDAYMTISSIPNINIINDKKYLTNFRQAEYQKLLENIMNNFEAIINEEMNIDNYNLIYREFIFVFDKIFGINQDFWYYVEKFGAYFVELVNSIKQEFKNFIGALIWEERNLYEDKDIFVFDKEDIYFDEVGKNSMIQRKKELEERLNIKRHEYLKILSQQLKNEN